LNQCAACIRTHVDITENIPKQGTLFFCRNCERYLNPPAEWVVASLESRELLSICLKRIKGLKDVKLIDAGFIWTEPHSKRIKVKLTVQGEITGGIVLQQVFIVEFTVNNQMCDDCHRTEAKDFWRCMVQVRQKASNKKSIYYLEQMILKHKAHENTLGIKNAPCGLDFYFSAENHARKLVDFIQNVLPVKTTQSKKLISHDIHSNTYNYKFTWIIDIVPISKGSLVCLNKKLQQNYGNIAPLCIVQNVASVIRVIDPLTAQIAEISGTNFFRYPFSSICDPRQLVEYYVMDIDKAKAQKQFPGQGAISFKHVVSDVWLVKSSELGLSEDYIHTKTHFGHLLKPGDTVLCFDLRDAVINNSDFEKLKNEKVPDIIIAKKNYGDKNKRQRSRKWKLKHLTSNNEENIEQ
jgi:nonsense-mediated mRNA decay protein 3